MTLDQKQRISATLSGEGFALLREMSRRRGISNTAVLELAIRRLATQWKVALKEHESEVDTAQEELQKLDEH